MSVWERPWCSAVAPFFLGRVSWGHHECAEINGTNSVLWTAAGEQWSTTLN